MADRGARPDHVTFLVEDHFGSESKEAEALREATSSKQPFARTTALLQLEKQKPGTLARLKVVWSAYGGHAIHLWSVPCLGGTTEAELRESASDLALEELVEGESAKVPAPDEDWEMRVHEVAVSNDGILFSVRLQRTRTLRADEGTASVDYVQDVPIVLHPNSANKDVIAEVHAGYQDARRALRFLLSDVFDQEVPRNFGPKQLAMLAPVKFLQSHADSLVKKLTLEEYGYDGMDVRGTGFMGEMKHQMPKQGMRFLPLDLTLPEIALQHAGVKSWRGYNFDHKHSADNFPEYNAVQLHFRNADGKRQPHILFKSRPSRPAVRSFVTSLRGLVT